MKFGLIGKSRSQIQFPKQRPILICQQKSIEEHQRQRFQMTYQNSAERCKVRRLEGATWLINVDVHKIPRRKLAGAGRDAAWGGMVRCQDSSGKARDQVLEKFPEEQHWVTEDHGARVMVKPGVNSREQAKHDSWEVIQPGTGSQVAADWSL